MSRGRSYKSRFEPDVPDPWLHRYGGVVLAFAMIIWSFYVVVGRVCTPMIRGESSSGLGRSVGVGTMIGYIILWLLMVWSYLKMILTGPGFARKFVSKTLRPDPSLEHITYPPAMLQHPDPPSGHGYGHGPDPEDPAGPDPSEVGPVFNLVNTALRNPERTSSSTTLAPTGTESGTSAAPILPNHGQGSQEQVKGASSKSKKGVRDWRTVLRPIPALGPSTRWCRFCEIPKPDRTHHCRHCGTCVLQFDHHCLWISQCVGWANHKFFITFTFWATMFCLYLMALLIVVLAKSPSSDGQMIGLVAVAALFSLFVGLMFATHVYLIVGGKTTLESYAARDQQEAEDRLLQTEYGYFFHNHERRKVQRKWKEEWGGSPVDARWAFGTKRQMWEQEMGVSPLGWIFPIGRPLGDGIHYAQNPRFGPNGEWLMKKDWPKQLQH